MKQTVYAQLAAHVTQSGNIIGFRVQGMTPDPPSTRLPNSVVIRWEIEVDPDIFDPITVSVHVKKQDVVSDAEVIEDLQVLGEELKEAS